MFEKFEHTFDIKSIDKESRIIQGVASLEVVDRDNEIIALDAISSSLNTFLKNPVIRFKHEAPIGRAIVDKTYVDYDKSAFVVTAHITDATQVARDAWALINDGIVKSFSVGGKVLEKEAIKDGDREINKITNMELYEVSVVDIPSNRESFFSVISKSISGDVEKQRMRDEIAQELFSKPYSQCSEEEKKKVHQEALKRRGGKPGEGRQSHDYGKDAEQDITKPKDQRPPKDWFDRCVRKVRAAGGAKDPEAVCAEMWRKKKKKEAEIEEKEIEDFLMSIKKVEKRGNKWCVIHCHGPKTGQPIKCFPTKAQADRMHRAIQANKDYSTTVEQKVGREDDSKNKEGEETKCLKSNLKSSQKESQKSLQKSPKQKKSQKSLLRILREKLLIKLQTS